MKWMNRSMVRSSSGRLYGDKEGQEWEGSDIQKEVLRARLMSNGKG